VKTARNERGKGSGKVPKRKEVQRKVAKTTNIKRWDKRGLLIAGPGKGGGVRAFLSLNLIGLRGRREEVANCVRKRRLTHS